MRVFIDTNILIDFVVNREGFSEDADKLFALGITGREFNKQVQNYEMFL